MTKREELTAKIEALEEIAMDEACGGLCRSLKVLYSSYENTEASRDLTITRGLIEGSAVMKIVNEYYAQLAALPPDQPELTRMAEWEDQRVQKVYELLCLKEIPGDENEHWEGRLARLIVASLFAQPEQADIAIDRAWVEGAKFGWNCAQYDECVAPSLRSASNRERHEALEKQAEQRFQEAIGGRLEQIREARKALEKELE